jgi:hypothetical protein
MPITTYQVRGFNLSPSKRKSTPNDGANIINNFLSQPKKGDDEKLFFLAPQKKYFTGKVIVVPCTTRISFAPESFFLKLTMDK